MFGTSTRNRFMHRWTNGAFQRTDKYKTIYKKQTKKWGIKLFVLAGQSGQIYDFIIYQGSTTEIEPELTALGSSVAVIMHLWQRIVSKNHRLYFDNYFGSYQLFQYLAMKSILYNNLFYTKHLQNVVENLVKFIWCFWKTVYEFTTVYL